MTETLRNEIEKIIRHCSLNLSIESNCDVESFVERRNRLEWDEMWRDVSGYEYLSEEFIREFKDQLIWYLVSSSQPLSEALIRECKDKVDWYYISIRQHLSEEFIREFKDKVNWDHISQYQHLSEEFIREFKDYVNWDYVCMYQHLSEEFIMEFKSFVSWDYISMYQYLSEERREELKNMHQYGSRMIPLLGDWLYASNEDKLKYIKENTKYTVVYDKYIIAYKSVRSNYYSVYTFQYKYEVGKTYTSHCDCNLDNENSFGLSAWTKERAIKYYPDGKLLKVKIPISKVGVIIRSKQKIRCFEFEVIEEVEK